MGSGMLPWRGLLLAGLLLIYAGIGAVAGVQAQVPEMPHLRVLTPRDGLPTAGIAALARDRAGFIWIASTDGLARYDGHGFRIWRHESRDPRSLPGNLVQAVHVDDRDRVWVATEFGGISMLDADRSGFRHWRRASHPILRSDDIFAFASRGDMLWFGTGDAGLYRMSLAGDPAGWKPEPIAGAPSETIINLEIDRAGRLWIATVEGLALLAGDKSGKIEPVSLPGEAPMPFVYSLLADGPRLWAGTAAGIFRREPDGRWLRLPYADMFERPNAAISLARGHDGALWIGSQRRLWRVAADDAVPQPIQSDPAYQPGSIQGLLMQPDGALWAALPGLGLGFLRPDWRSIAQLRHSSDGSGLLGSGYRATAVAAEGGVWLAGADGHIERVDGTGVAERIGDDIRARLPRSKPVTLVEDPRGQIWIYYGRTGLWRIGRDGRLDSWLPGTGADAAPADGYKLMAVVGDRLWLLLPRVGLEARDLASGRIVRRIDARAAGLGDADGDALKAGPDGKLWIAGDFGLGWLDEASGRLVVPAALRGERVFAFDFGSADSLWLHRLDGLSRHLKTGGRWQQAAKLAAGRELPSLQPGGLEVDARGRVWLASKRGLYRWDPRRRHLDRYGIQNGLSSQEFFNRTMSLTAGGMLAATTGDGAVVLVDTRYPDPPAHTPELRIDGIDVRRHGEWLPQPLRSGLSFGPEDRELRLVGHLLAFNDPGATRYWSRLEGFDKGWIDQGTQGERVFSGLGPGRYTLRLRAMDAAGHAAVEQRLSFQVRPPWWRTGLALAAALLLLLGLLGGLARDYRRRLERSHALALAEQKRNLAEQASEAKTRFLATLGHEIRTPMTGVLGMAELLQGSRLDDQQRRQVESIWRAGRHLLRLVNDALDLARIEADRLVLVVAPFDLNALIDEVVALLAPLASAKGLDFVLRRAPDVPRWVQGDATRIGQILLNLLGNAIKFTERGEVGLTVELAARDCLRFVIHDSGPGLNEEQRLRLFRRFEQADGERTRARYGGSGLGLAISQELAAMMDGRIDVESAPGAGARFSVELSLPATAPAADPAPAHAQQPQAAPAQQLLLVEDDATVAEVIAGLLRAQGHAVRHAAHALAALAEVASMAFDAALLDLDLPGMDGFALARQLRLGGFDGPLLAVTARADAEAEQLAHAAGFDAFLRKPVTSDLLAAALREAMRMRARSRGYSGAD